MGGQMWNPHPGQDQEARVVGDEADVGPPCLGVPADVAVTAAQMARRRTPRHAGDRSSVRPGQILQVLAYWLLIAKIVMMFHEAVEQRFIGGASHRLDLDR